ncbi:hypothetical protein [Campylobacter iguaniorum]|uniref:hypothetical protein n=1 Tax=Campylobacter iguaniorum TaxID=1244531 RepID=UPI00073A458F|nr:hypothetical protein [Campylobacter iguaniorum]
MKKIFLIFGFLGLFAIQLLGVDVYCNDSPNGFLKSTNSTKYGINTIGHKSEDIVTLDDRDTYKFNLFLDNMRTPHGVDNWNQVSIRIKTAFKSIVKVRITKLLRDKGIISKKNTPLDYMSATVIN